MTSIVGGTTVASHRSHTYQHFFSAPKRTKERRAKGFVIEWLPVLATTILATLVVGMALQLAY
jgi:hypothetical protein